MLAPKRLYVARRHADRPHFNLWTLQCLIVLPHFSRKITSSFSNLPPFSDSHPFLLSHSQLKTLQDNFLQNNQERNNFIFFSLMLALPSICLFVLPLSSSCFMDQVSCSHRRPSPPPVLWRPQYSLSLLHIIFSLTTGSFIFAHKFPGSSWAFLGAQRVKNLPIM